MPTISQLPAAGLVTAADELPISQNGSVCAVSVGALLASTQPTILIESPSLLGRTSLGAGAPEQVGLGTGLSNLDGTLVADGLDHATFASADALSTDADVVISNQGTPMLMQTSLLRGLFTAGANISIDANGTITATLDATSSTPPADTTSTLTISKTIAAGDLIAINHSGTNYAVTYDTLLNGIMIDQAETATAISDTDLFWIAQGSNVLASQSFSSLWNWLSGKLKLYKCPIIELTATTTLDGNTHNGCILICSQPILILPSTSGMGNGFNCTAINVSSFNVTLGSGFTSSNGSLIIAPWQTATLSCLTYSAGTIAYAAMPSAAAASSLPGQVIGLTSTGATASSVTISWQAPASGSAPLSYVVKYCITGAATWSSGITVNGGMTYQFTGLQSSTSYDFVVMAQNSQGVGVASAVLTVQTVNLTQILPPNQVTGLAGVTVTSTNIQLTWVAQTGTNAATSYTVQYRVSGTIAWSIWASGLQSTSSTITGLQPSTSYDFTVTGVNSAGNGANSAIVAITTSSVARSVAAITWNLVPSGNFTRGTGAIGVNAHVSPASAAIQFGFSTSVSIPPSSWTTAVLVNTDLWGAYVPTPSTSGSWYTWAEGLDGSSATVNGVPFNVQ